MPSWSRRSMKHTPPRLRATSVQPHRVTDWPIRASSMRPQKWVRMGAPETVSGSRKGSEQPGYFEAGSLAPANPPAYHPA